MTNEQTADFEAQLKKRGWAYHPIDGEFRSGTRRVEWEEIIGLIPGTNFDFLMAYETARHNEWLTALPPNSRQ
jgi:hypothetical protein